MKKLLLLLAVFSTLCSTAQIRITSLPTHSGAADDAWVPIVVDGVNQKVYGRYLSKNRIDSLVNAIAGKQATLGFTPVPNTRTISINGAQTQPLSSNINLLIPIDESRIKSFTTLDSVRGTAAETHYTYQFVNGSTVWDYYVDASDVTSADDGQNVLVNTEGVRLKKVYPSNILNKQLPATSTVPDSVTYLNRSTGKLEVAKLPLPSGTTWGSITGTLSAQSDLTTALAAKISSASPNTTGLFKHGAGVTTTIPDGAGTAFTPDLLISNNGDLAAIGVFANDGTNNRRIGLFADNANGVVGISHTTSSTGLPFEYRNSSGPWFRINTNGAIRMHFYTTAGYLKNAADGTISSSAAIAQADVTGLVAALAAKPSVSRTFLASDVSNTTTSFASITGLQFPVTAGKKYEFKFFIVYSAAATTTGVAFSINGPTLTQTNYVSSASLSTTSVFRNIRSGYNLGTETSNSISANNIGLIEGTIECSASGNVVATFKSGVGGSAITVNGGLSWVKWEQLN